MFNIIRHKHKLFTILIVTLVSSLVFNSCNVHYGKRRYNKGYYVHFNKNKSFKAEKTLAKPEKEEASYFNANRNEKQLTAVGQKQDNQLAVYSNPLKTTEQHPLVASSNKKTKTRNISSSNQNFTPYNASVKKLELTKKQNVYNNRLLYAVTALMGALSFALIRSKKKSVFNYTRWANKNKRKAQISIWLMQTGILLGGFYIGKGAHYLGYEFSNYVEYIMGGVTALGFGVLFSAKSLKNPVSIFQFFLKKFIFLIMAASFFASSVVIGNKVVSKREQISPMGYTMVAYNYVADSVTDNIMPVDKPESEKKHNKFLIGLSIFLLVLLCIILFAAMAVASCASICLLAFAAEDPVLFWGALGALVLAVALTFAFIYTVKLINKLKDEFY